MFLGKISFKNFLSKHLGEKIGNIIEEETNEILGEHKGFWFYTIGQRQGLDLSGGPWYVTNKNMESNTVYVSRNYYEPQKKRDHFYTKEVHWISGKEEIEKIERVKIRHGEEFYKCTMCKKIQQHRLRNSA